MKETNWEIETIVAEIEISYIPKINPSSRPVISTPEDAYRVLLNTWDETKLEFVEQFKVVLLNRANRVLGICTLFSGTSTHTLADPKLVFAVALKANASEIILAHNHPAGSLSPSKDDFSLTYKMKACGDLLDLKVFDHLIVTSEGFYSFAQAGIL